MTVVAARPSWAGTVGEAMRESRGTAVRRVGDLMHSAIVAGEMPTLLPGELELQRTYGLSRNVIRDALALLSDEGLVDRVQGTGTLIVGQRFQHRIDRVHGFGSSEAGTDVRRETLAVARVRAAPIVRSVLRLPEDSEAIMIERITMAGSAPTGLWTSYLPPRLAEVAERLGPDDALRDVISAVAGSGIDTVEFLVNAAVAHPAIAEDLEIAPGAAVLRQERVTWLQDGTAAEFAIGWGRGDRFSLHTVRR